jgi:hypothetical protein
VKKLKCAYDAAQQQDGASISEGEIEDDHPNDEATDLLPASQSGALVDDLVHEVTESEPKVNQSHCRPWGQNQHRRRTDVFRTGEKSVKQK